MNLSYKICFVSSREDDFSHMDISQPTPTSKGWSSKRYCIYPQFIILQLHSRSIVDEIRLITDKNKVPLKMNFYLGDVPDFKDLNPDVNEAYFMQVGSLTLPLESNYRLCHNVVLHTKKSGQSTCIFIKISFTSNQISKKNEFNQVSIVGIEIFGSPLKVQEVSRLSIFDLLYVDAKINDIRVQLYKRKEMAHASGRYIYEKKIQRANEELKNGGEILAAMIIEARQHLDQKEFAKAKMKNAEIEKFRGELLSNLEIEGLCEKNGQREENDIEDLEKFKKDYEIPALILDKPIPKESREIGINTTPTVEKNTILSNLFGETSSLIDKEIDPSSELNEYGKSSSTENKPNATQDEKSDFKTFEVPDSAIYDPPVEDDFSPRILDVPDNSVTDAQKNSEENRKFDGDLGKEEEENKKLNDDLRKGNEEEHNNYTYPTSPLPDEKMNNKLPRKKYVEPKGESLKNVKLKINDSVAKELSLAISVYGQERIAKSVNKHAIIRMEGSEEILKRFKSLRNNHSPHSSKKVFKATSDILMRLLKDLLIKIFRDGINLMMLLYNDFASRYSIPLDDLIYSAEESLFHLILKSSDVTNTKISVLSEGSIQNLIRIKSLHKSDEFQKTILRPLSEKATTGKDLPPKCDEMKAKIVLWYLQMQGRKELLPTRLVKRGTRFGVSAIQNVENKVKKQGKTILIILYKNNPDWVQDYVIQNISSSSRKSIIVRSLLQEMEGRHKSQ